MNELVDYFKQELNALYEGSLQFAKQHPNSAKQLQIDLHGCHDPHIIRLLEGTAYLNARLHKKLDDDYAEFTNTLLQVLYPHYLAPIPSSGIIQLKPAPDLALAHAVPRHSLFSSSAEQGPICHFRTVYPTIVWPVEVTNLQLRSQLLDVPSLPSHVAASQVLELSLSITNQNIDFKALTPRQLRFYLNGARADMLQLYESLLTNTCAIAVSSAKDKSSPVTWLSYENLKAIGFSEDEALLPQAERCLSTYRLLTEFFVIPEKFLFIDLVGLDAHRYSNTRELIIYIYFKHPLMHLTRPLTSSNIQINCTPVVNLFEHSAEPISIDHTKAEYAVIADARRADIQVHSIENASAISVYGEETVFRPLYGTAAMRTEETTGFWQSHWRDEPDGKKRRLSISLIEPPNFNEPQDWTLMLKILCSNGNSPQELYFQAQTWQLQTDSELVKAVTWVTSPTPCYQPSNQQKNWELISHLNLNYLSLTENGNVLQKLLSLYNLADNPANQLMIAGIAGVKVQHKAIRIPVQGLFTVCQGVQIIVDVQESYYPGQSVYLFGCLLEQVLSRYASINSFIQLIITTHHFNKELHQWKPRTGTSKLL